MINGLKIIVAGNKVLFHPQKSPHIRGLYIKREAKEQSLALQERSK